jgi:polysaccharide biosynthesis transport protein
MTIADQDQDDNAGGTFSLDRALSALRRRSAMIAICTGVAIGMSLAIATMIPNRYDAVASVQVDPRKKSISNLEGVVSELKADAATVESEVEIIKSRAILLKVIDALDLRHDEEFSSIGWDTQLINAVGAGEMQADGSEPSQDTRSAVQDPIGKLLGDNSSKTLREPDRDAVAAAIAANLSVSRLRTTLLIEIKFSSRDATKAARIANAIAEIYLQEQLAGKVAASEFASRALEDKLTVLRSKVTHTEQRVADFKAANNIFDAEGQILSEKQLARHMEQTVIARNATAESRSKYEQAKKLRDRGISSPAITNVLESHTVRLMKESLSKATQREAELLTKYGPKHPEMLKVRAEVADAQLNVRTEVDNLVTSLKNDFEAAEDRERQLAENFVGLKDGQIIAKEASVRLKELERESQTEKQLYEALLTRYKQTTETQDLQLADSRIIQRADVPLSPASPKRKQVVMIALFGGLFASIILTLMLEFVTSGVVTREDIERELSLPHLSSIPNLGGANGASIEAVRAIRMILAEPRSLFADTIRTARREIDARRRHSGPRVILVAASLPNEGTETIASNLAHLYAMSGERVLLMDTDLRRATLTRQLTPSRQLGLMDVLINGQPLHDAILHDTTTGIHFLPAMSQQPVELSSPEILSSPSMAAIFAALKREFNVIVVDTAPLLPVMDGRLIADHADQIVFIMTWRKTPKQFARRALRSLGANQAKIAGAMINQVDPSTLEDAMRITKRKSVLLSYFQKDAA